MLGSVPNLPRRSTNSFQKLVDGFFKQSGLPFSDVITAAMIKVVFRKHRGLFGIDAIYSTATVLWAFLGQVLQDGKMAACQSAVAGIIAHRQLLGLDTPTEDTGDYCRARAKLKEQALHELTTTVAQNTESEADSSWLIQGRHAKLVDGFTFTMPDTERNQQEYPQAKTQQPGIGFPIARCVAILDRYYLFLHDHRRHDIEGYRCLLSKTPSSSQRFSTRQTTGQIRPLDCLATSSKAALDGRRSVSNDPRTDHAERNQAHDQAAQFSN